MCHVFSARIPISSVGIEKISVLQVAFLNWGGGGTEATEAHFASETEVH